MSNAFPGHTAPAAGFDAPLAMLAQCHRRFEQQCSTLQRLATHLPQHGADAQAQQAATAVMRYFDSAARQHHEDEEQDLLPAMIEAMAGSDAVCLRGLSETLAAQHRGLETLWAAVRRELQPVGAAIADGSPGRALSLDATAVKALVNGYREHIALEEAQLLPMAARLLDDAALRRMGSAMRRRRGIAEGD